MTAEIVAGPVDVATFGEVMVLLSPVPSSPDEPATLTRTIAGAESNLAIALSRLGRRVRFVSAVGDDAFGRAVVDTLEREGVDTAGIAVVDDAPTGILVRTLVPGAEPVTDYHRAGSAASRLAADLVSHLHLDQARILHVTGITPALSASCRRATFAAVEAARDAGCTIVFDPNVRPSLWSSEVDIRRVLGDLAARADVVVPGASEACLLTGQDDPVRAARALAVAGPAVVAVKRGPTGSFAVVGDALVDAPATPVADVVDPVGAGDAWAAGLVSVLLEADDALDLDTEVVTRALARANVLGALTARFRGDWEGLPDRDELARLEAQHG